MDCRLKPGNDDGDLFRLKTAKFLGRKGPSIATATKPSKGIPLSSAARSAAAFGGFTFDRGIPFETTVAIAIDGFL